VELIDQSPFFFFPPEGPDDGLIEDKARGHGTPLFVDTRIPFPSFFFSLPPFSPFREKILIMQGGPVPGSVFFFPFSFFPFFLFGHNHERKELRPVGIARAPFSSFFLLFSLSKKISLQVAQQGARFI